MVLRFRLISAFVTFIFVWTCTFGPTLFWPAESLLAHAGEEPPVAAVIGFQSEDSLLERQARVSLFQSLQRSNRVKLVPDNVSYKHVEKTWREGRSETSALLEQAFKDYRDGKKLYENLSLDEAIKALDSAVSGYRKGISALRENRYLLASHLYLGMALIIRGHSKDGSEYVRQMITLDPSRAGHKLPTREFPPKIVELHEQLTKQVVNGPRGSIEVRTKPNSAAVFLDAVQQSPSPVVVKEVPVGEHFLVVEKKGYRPYTQRVDVKAGTVSVEVNLEPWELTQPFVFDQRRDLIAMNNLAQLGESLGTNILVLGRMKFLAEQDVSMTAQLFDTRSKEFSMIVREDTKRGDVQKGAKRLASKLLKNLTNNGLVVAQLSPPATLSGNLDVADNSSPLPSYEPDTPMYKTWWFWTIVGVAVAGGAVGGLLVLKGGSDSSKNILVIENPIN